MIKALGSMKEVLKTGHIKSREYDILTKKGGRVPVDMSAAIIKDATGHPIGIVGISRDITERKKMEKVLQKSLQELKESRDSLDVRVQAKTKELRELAESLDAKVQQQTKELRKRVNELARTKSDLESKVEEMEAFHKITMGREEKIIELKERIKELEGRLLKE
jgi:vacuolar-type H+-ATPase subunit I/STV1